MDCSDPVLTIRAGRLAWRFPGGKVLPYVAGGEGPAGVLDREAEQLRTQIAAAEEKSRGLKEAFDADLADLATKGVTLAGMTKEQFDEWDRKGRDADDAIQDVANLRERLNKVLTRAAADPARVLAGSGSGGADTPLNREERRLFADIAKRFVGSEPYKRLVDSGQLKNQGSHFSTDPVEVLERGSFDADTGELDSPLIRALQPAATRTTVNVGDAGAVVPIDQQVWPPVQIPVRKIRLLDLVTMLTTESDMVNFVQQSVRSDYAIETPYGTVAPEADYEFALKQASVKRIPQFIPATKDVLADQGQLKGLLQDQLMAGVRLRLEQAIWNGNGANFTDTALQGMLSATGIGSVTYQGSGHSSEYQLDAYHRALTTIRLTLFDDPTAIVLAPVDYEWAVLKRDSYGRYLFEPNTEGDVTSIWGLTTAVTPLATQGTALVGDFKQAYRVWIRTGLAVTASTEHLDFFTRGMVALLAEMRVAAATVLPRALCQVVSLTGP